MQRRGVVHFHAIIRLDGYHPDTPDTVLPPPRNWTPPTGSPRSTTPPPTSASRPTRTRTNPTAGISAAPFKQKALADSFRSDLMSAARKGEAFVIVSGRPVSMHR